MKPRHFALAALLVATLGPSPARAVGDEIQVYTDAIDEAGVFGVELHLNYVGSGRRTSEFAGEIPPHHVFQATPEFSYGLGHGFEAGLYVPFMVAPGGHVFENGLRARMKYIAPHGTGRTVFWGLNGEFGYTAPRVSETAWGLELRPIIGWTDGRWLLVANPVLGFELSGGASRRPSFDPCVKAAYTVAPGVQAGIEHYAGFGPVGRWASSDEREQQTYVALDIERGKFGLNVGVGHGWTTPSEAWVVKAIISLPF